MGTLSVHKGLIGHVMILFLKALGRQGSSVRRDEGRIHAQPGSQLQGPLAAQDDEGRRQRIRGHGGLHQQRRTDEIRFSRQTIANDSEVVADIYRMRGDIDQRTALRLNPYIQEEEIEGLVTE